MARRRSHERLYGPDGADLLEAFPATQIATFRDKPYHIHFRGVAAVDDSALGWVARMPEIQEIVANDTGITGAGLRHLAALPKLEILHLAGTPISAAAAAALLNLPMVWQLDLSRTGIGEAGLLRLGAMPALRRIWAVDCGLSEDAHSRIKRAMPQCRVIVDRSPGE
ncbi:hypothetical protein BH10PSE17_BH10PSE17_03330 [soil metagenome]